MTATGGAAAGGGTVPPKPSRRGGFGDPPDPSDKEASDAYWWARQKGLCAGDIDHLLEPHEIRLWEEVFDAGGKITLIARPAKVLMPHGRWERLASNDATLAFPGVLVNASPVEAKSFASPKASRIKAEIARSVGIAQKWGVTKDIFLVYSRQHPITDSVLRQVADYNLTHPLASISRLLIWRQGQLVEVELHQGTRALRPGT
ncbi:hypothetical protein [Microbacterium sp.]|uniref:hypothetical protein n=1 Tax=Microbacterium sp. TaxID=51671 RepID=UPI0039E26026